MCIIILSFYSVYNTILPIKFFLIITLTSTARVQNLEINLQNIRPSFIYYMCLKYLLEPDKLKKN